MAFNTTKSVYTKKQMDKLLELDEIMKSYRIRSGELMEMYYWVKDGYKETEMKEDVLAMIYERAQIYTKESEKAFKKQLHFQKMDGKGNSVIIDIMPSSSAVEQTTVNGEVPG